MVFCEFYSGSEALLMDGGCFVSFAVIAGRTSFEAVIACLQFVGGPHEL